MRDIVSAKARLRAPSKLTVISIWVLEEVLLMIRVGLKEVTRGTGFDQSGNLFLGMMELLHFRRHLVGNLKLLRTVRENGGTILRSTIVALAASVGGVVRPGVEKGSWRQHPPPVFG